MTQLDEATTSHDDPETAGDVPRHPRSRVERWIDVAVGFVCLGVATAWTFNPLRAPYSGRTFSNFFEAQARAFLRGDLALEKGELGIEAFVRNGADYMYFGPLLAIFRIPFVAVEFLEGRLTAISLLVGTLVFYLQAIKLFDIVLELVHPEGRRSQREQWFRLGWRASVATGTVVLSLLAIPWVYHEAHLWSAALFLALLNQMLRFEDLTARQITTFGVILIGVVFNRPTTAYAGMLGVAMLLVVVVVRRTATRGLVLRLGAWLGAAFVATVSINFVKFRRPFGIPMEAQVFSTVDENRAEMLRINEGKYFRLEFIPTNVWAYFRPNGIDLSTTFPFVSTPRAVPRVFGDYFYDATYRTASITATNPLLVIGSFLGVFVLVKLAKAPVFWRLAAPVAAGVLAAGGVAGWGYIATRYLTDFLPGMLLLTAIGLAWSIKRFDEQPERLPSTGVRRAGRAVAVSLVVWSIVSNVAISVGYNFSAGDEAAGVDRLLSAQDAVANVIGEAPSDRVVRVDALRYDRDDPTRAGTLAVVGDCEALYSSNGEPVDTWLAVEYGPSDWRTVFSATPAERFAVGNEFEVVRIDETASADGYFFRLVYRVDEIFDDEQIVEYSLIMIDNFGVITVDELEMSLDGATEFAVTFDRFRRNFFVERNGENILYGHFDMDPLYDAADPISRFVPFGAAAGLRIDPVTVTTPWCDRLTTSPP